MQKVKYTKVKTFLAKPFTKGNFLFLPVGKSQDDDTRK